TGADPLAAERRILVHDLLCWQAARTLRDHWFTDLGKTPYYRTVGLDYIKDARPLALEGFSITADKAESDKRGAMVNALNSRLAEPGVLVAGWRDGSSVSSTLQLTDETRLRRQYSISIPKAVDEGTVALRFEHGPGLDPAPADWLMRPIDAAKKEIAG